MSRVYFHRTKLGLTLGRRCQDWPHQISDGWVIYWDEYKPWWKRLTIDSVMALTRHPSPQEPTERMNDE